MVSSCTIGRAQSLSELPESLGSWAGQRFLEVGPRASVDTSDVIVRDRCSRLVDALTARGVEVPRDLDLLWQATSAVVGDGNWKAKVLKPSTTFALDRTSVEMMRKWSGGEKVTMSAPSEGDQKPRRSLTMIAVTRPGVITLLMMTMLFTPLGTP